MRVDIFSNRWLVVKKGVKEGSFETSQVIVFLDRFFESCKSYVTSILRDPKDQLRIIIDYAKKLKVPVDFTENDFDVKIGDRYIWQKTWSRLLNLGVIISPPRPAVCLEDYIRGGVNMKGKVINASPHFTGYAFDISGQNLDKIIKVIEKAKLEDQNLKILIKNYLVEHNNNCVHVDVNQV